MQDTKEIIKQFRAGEEFSGDIGQFISAGSPKPDLLKELRQTLVDEDDETRELIFQLIAEIGVAVDPLYEAGGRLIRDRSILTILIDDGLSRKGISRNYCLNTLQYAVPPGLLNQYGDKLVANLRSMPDPTLLLVIAKAKPRQAVDVIDGLMEDPRWSNSVEGQITSAALGNKKIEQEYVSRFLKESDPHKKAEYARYLGFIGTEAALKALASEMRTDLVIENPGVTIRSVRIFIIDALSYNFPEKTFLWDNAIEDDEGYARVERFCEETFGTTWDVERPPFLWIQGFPSEPPEEIE